MRPSCPCAATHQSISTLLETHHPRYEGTSGPHFVRGLRLNGILSNDISQSHFITRHEKCPGGDLRPLSVPDNGRTPAGGWAQLFRIKPFSVPLIDRDGTWFYPLVIFFSGCGAFGQKKPGTVGAPSIY
jgi:hypothetical protein